MQIEVEELANGYPALWIGGGAHPNGKTTITAVLSNNCKKRKQLRINKNYTESDKKMVLVGLTVGDIIIIYNDVTPTNETKMTDIAFKNAFTALVVESTVIETTVKRGKSIDVHDKSNIVKYVNVKQVEFNPFRYLTSDLIVALMAVKNMNWKLFAEDKADKE